MKTPVFPNQKKLRAEYNKFLSRRNSIVRELEQRIEEVLAPLPSRPRVSGRVKSFESYYRKRLRLLKEGSAARISDLIGIRVICLFIDDLSAVEELLKERFKILEVERKGRDHNFREFGYESVHFLIAVPEDILNKSELPRDETVEIQLRTILQDAWAEVEHELVYKAQFTPFDDPLKRKLAAVNASLSLADIIFQEIRNYQRELNLELGRRRDSFFRKIEESTDAVLFSGDKILADTRYSPSSEEDLSLEGDSPASQADLSNASIDDLLLNALHAHNKNQFGEAIALYTRILEMRPADPISSLIYKHRGMAYFARSHYEEAIADFYESLKLDPKSYKSAYYEGVVCSVIRYYPQAVDAFNRSLEINPYQPYCLYRRAQAYFHLEDYPMALSDCEAALTMEPFEAAKKLKDMLLGKLKM